MQKDQGSPSSSHTLCPHLPSSCAQMSPWTARNESAKRVWGVLGVQTPLMKACSFPHPQCGKCPRAGRDHSQLLSAVPTLCAGISAREHWFEKPLLWCLLLAGLESSVSPAWGLQWDRSARRLWPLSWPAQGSLFPLAFPDSVHEGAASSAPLAGRGSP